MQKLFIYLSLIIFGSSVLLSNEMQTKPSEIDTLISEIKSAKSPDRRVLMNRLKVKLRTMNQETRRKTMMSLKKSFGKNGSNKMGQHRQKRDGSGKNMQGDRGNQQPQNRPNRPNRNGQHKGK